MVYQETENNLAGDKKLFPCDGFVVDLLLDGLSHFCLVLVGQGTVNMAITDVDGNLHGFQDLAWFGLKLKENCRYVRMANLCCDASIYKLAQKPIDC